MKTTTNLLQIDFEPQREHYYPGIGTERLPATIRLTAIAPAMDVMICRILGACATCKSKLCVAKLVEYAPDRHTIQDSESNKPCHYRSVRLSTMHCPFGSNFSGAVSTKLCMSSMYRKIRLEFHLISNKQTLTEAHAEARRRAVGLTQARRLCGRCVLRRR